MKKMSLFGERLRKCRKIKGLTQKQIASEFGVTEQHWQAYERGVKTPTFVGLLAIADFFEVSLDYLVGREQSNAPLPTVSSNSLETDEHLQNSGISAKRNNCGLCDECDEPFIPQFSFGLFTVLEFLKLAEKEGVVPKLPDGWWLSLVLRYHKYF